MADAPSFSHTTSPQVGPGEGSKTLKHYYGTRYDLKYIIQYPTDKGKGFKSFKLQIGAKIDHFLIFLNSASKVNLVFGDLRENGWI